jgi:hypothetical protein
MTLRQAVAIFCAPNRTRAPHAPGRPGGPDWTIPDPHRPGVERRFRAIPEFGGRVLRVACYETPVNIRILTVFFDRKARRPR